MKRNALLLFLLLALTTSLAAQNSARISIQGTLRDGAGTAVPNGLQTITFKLFNTTSGGTAVWEEQADVTVTGGIYTHLLGSVNPLNPAVFSQTLYVGIIINGKELLPRTELTYSPYTLYVQSAGNGSPAGSVTAFLGNTIPSGWLLCNGQALSSTEYPLLHSLIGTTYGDGSGGINGGAGKDFNLPDYRGYFLRGSDEGRGLDQGRTLGSVQQQGTKSPNSPFTGTTSQDGAHVHQLAMVQQAANVHQHAINDRVSSGGNAGGSTTTYITSNAPVLSAGDHTHTVSVNDGGDAETRPLNMSVRYIIKY